MMVISEPMRGFADLAFDYLLWSLREGFVGGTNSVPGKHEEAADVVQELFSRVNTRSSNGYLWASDFCDPTRTGRTDAYDETLTNKVWDLVHNESRNTNSPENRNRSLKAFLDHKKMSLRALCDKLRSWLRELSRNDRINEGLAWQPLPYGGGRTKTTRHAEDWRIGMLYLGFTGGNDHVKHLNVQQLVFPHFYADGEVAFFMPSRQSVLDELKEDSVTVNRQKLFRWFKHYQKVMESSYADLREKIDKKLEEHQDMDKIDAFRSIAKVARRFVCVTPLRGDFTDHDADHPFHKDEAGRVKKSDRNCSYPYKCTCARSLKRGFCAHIFVMTHIKTDKWSDDLKQKLQAACMPERRKIPHDCYSHNIGKKRKAGRPGWEAPLHVDT